MVVATRPNSLLVCHNGVGEIVRFNAADKNCLTKYVRDSEPVYNSHLLENANNRREIEQKMAVCGFGSTP